MKNTSRLKSLYEKTTFQKFLAVTMVCMVSIVLLLFSLIVIWMSEGKIRRNVKDNMSVVVKQLDVYLGNYISNIYNGFTSFESNQNLIQLRLSADNENYLSYTAASYLQVNKLLYQFLYANSDSVYNVYINFCDGRVGTQAYEKDLLKISYKYDTWKQRFPENKYYWVNADACRDLIPDKKVGAVLFHLYEDVNNNRNGIILIAMKEKFFEDVLKVEVINTDSCLSLITDYGIMHFGEDKAATVVEKRKNYLSEKAEAVPGIQSELLGDYYFMYKNMNLTGWKLVYTVEESSISNAHYIMRDTMIITFITVVISAMLLSLWSKAVSRPLQELTKKVEAKDVLEHEIAIHSYLEITSLSNGLEGMRKRINALLGEVEVEQEAKRQIEIALMQEQINPHFLYNALYSIMQLCEMKQPEKASRMLEALATFYRTGLNEGRNIITVEEELRHVENYLFIQKSRYSDLFDYTIDCAPEILKCRIPKMSLQPLVENAIYHGVKMKHGFGNICILGGTYDGSQAYLEVHDDGPGMTEEKINEIRRYLDKKIIGDEGISGRQRVSFGMKNVDSRIKFEFGKEAGVQLSSASEDTCVRILFTMREMGEEGVQ